MRTLLVLAILFTAVLAGCTNKGGGHDDKFTCPNGVVIDLSDYPDHDNATFNATSKCPKGGVVPKGNSTTNSTSRAPNVVPTLVFTAKNDTGNVTNITLLGGNLTFSGMGSVDTDGNITGMAMSITDSNATRTISLYDAATKTFPDVLVSFDRAGRNNVSVAVVDDRGGFTTLETKVYVDEVTIAPPHSFDGSAGPSWSNAGNQFPECAEALTAGDQAVLSSAVLKDFSINVVDEASWIEAVGGTSSQISMVICTPANGTTPGNVISNRGNSVATLPEHSPLPPATGVKQYAAWAYRIGAPNPNTEITFTFTTHYGPRPAA